MPGCLAAAACRQPPALLGAHRALPSTCPQTEFLRVQANTHTARLGSHTDAITPVAFRTTQEGGFRPQCSWTEKQWLRSRVRLYRIRKRSDPRADGGRSRKFVLSEQTRVSAAKTRQQGPLKPRYHRPGEWALPSTHPSLLPPGRSPQSPQDRGSRHPTPRTASPLAFGVEPRCTARPARFGASKGMFLTAPKSGLLCDPPVVA